ncbi:MAG: GTP cyclohydrolase I FolE2 [Thermoprotei archaeon]|nr:MAG: GTP cyclohydrolase I FolE2 [Thermoprotei archaeon]
MNDMPELQETEPELLIAIDRVGVKGVRRRITIDSPIGPLFYDVEIDVFVDLPRDLRGIHMSRNMEVILEAIDEARQGHYVSLEKLFEAVGRKLLTKHKHARKAEIVVRTTYYYEENINGKKVPEAADVYLSISIWRDGNIEWTVGVSLEGMTVCPSAQATYSVMEKTELHKSPSHSQRARLSIKVTTCRRIARIEWLVNAARDAFSSPTYSLLKRMDEYLVIKKAFEKPRLVEDLVRYALHYIATKLSNEGFPGNTRIFVEAESYESIHPYNVYACREALLSEVLKEVQQG